MDVNGDGRKDMFWVNMNSPALGYINASTSPRLAIRIPDTTDYEGYRFIINGEAIFHLPQQGLGSDQASLVTLPVSTTEESLELRIVDTRGTIVKTLTIVPNQLSQVLSL